MHRGRDNPSERESDARQDDGRLQIFLNERLTP